MPFLFINKTLRLNNLKTRRTMNAKILAFVICVEAIIYLLLYNFHEWTFKVIVKLKKLKKDKDLGSYLIFKYLLNTRKLHSRLEKQSGKQNWILELNFAIKLLIIECCYSVSKLKVFEKNQFNSDILKSFTALKVPLFGVFLVRIQSECGKIRTRKTPSTDTRHAVFTDQINYRITKNQRDKLKTTKWIKV